MYFWKCWRDTRSVFLGFVGSLLAVGAFGLYVQADPFGWIAAKPEALRMLWQQFSDAMGRSAGGVVVAAAFILGALGVGVEFERGTADFLLTRPRSRRAFLWTSWCVGAAQLLTLVPLAQGIDRLTTPASPVPRPSMDHRLLPMCTIALLAYSVTYLMTTLARNSRNGTGLSLSAFMGYVGLLAGLALWYGITIPVFWDLSAFFGRRASGVGYGSMLGWLSISLALTVVAQRRFDRMEV